MKILHFSDLHANNEQCKSLLEICAAEKPDLLALSGDITYWQDSEKDSALLEKAKEWVETVNILIPVAFCSGNHEAWTQGFSAANWNVFCKDGESKTFKKGQEKCIITSFPWHDNELVPTQALKAERDQKRISPDATRIWLHHEPAWPSGCGWNGYGYQGNRSIQLLVREYKPHFLLSGHIHCAPYTGGKAIERLNDTICLNPGSSSTRNDQYYTKAPKYCKIDTVEKTAEWC